MTMTCSRRALLTLAVAAPLLGAAAPQDPRLAVVWRCRTPDCRGYEYDGRRGDLDHPDQPTPPGVAFDDLPEDWCCPVCGGPKSAFSPLGG